jgi:sulfatase maturation enzyme AslB (radical SAM superfamily)
MGAMTDSGTATLRLTAFRELWIHTGTACNLSCPFCHEGSKPGDERIGAPTLAELAPVLDAAVAQNVERFAFTGGEPLILREILPILLHALALKPALVLTNGTAPFIRRAHQLATLRAAAHALSFRVSIDYPDETRHDAGRGYKNFRKALEGLRLLHAAGFAVGITRQITPGENGAAVEARFRTLLRKHQLPEEMPVLALPELGALEAATGAPAAVTADAITMPCPPACTRSRMLLKRAGVLRVAPCPLVDDDATLEWPAEPLADALAAQVETRHRRCHLCLTQGVNYGGAA